MTAWKWSWPGTGSAPTNQGLDSEMFDRTDYPYTDTFVREAIQNTLDAIDDKGQPVSIHFRFHQGALGPRKDFLEEALSYRELKRLRIPDEWRDDTINWLTIEDFNTKGLAGNLQKRSSDFWNYWLNFGISNKEGHSRGGRGIGRVTFLIASQIHTVIGLTRRKKDGITAACGMCVLKAGECDGVYKSTHAYLAAAEDDPIYSLHDSQEFHSSLQKAFEFTGYGDAGREHGLALAIPYPYPQLTANGILASAIEHFAPAIMANMLVVQVNDIALNATTLAGIAADVKEHMHNDAIRQDTARYLDLIGKTLSEEAVDISITDVRNELLTLHDKPDIRRLQKKLENGEQVALKISFPLVKDREEEIVYLKTIIARTPAEQGVIDRLFRDGMSLPEVRASYNADLDMITLVDHATLATYLNYCEGKAHLDLLESQEVREKLEEKGFDGLRVKRFVKNLPRDLRQLFIPDIREPDASIFDTFFAISKKNSDNKPKAKPDGPVIDIPPPKVPAFIVETLADGFRYHANPQYRDWPVNASIRVAYADGTRRPSWSEYDFIFSDLQTEHEGFMFATNDNEIRMTGCTPESSIRVTGFDANRELDTQLRVWKDAQTD